MMFCRGFSFLVFVLFQDCSLAQTNINFHAFPSQINPGFTKNLTVRCSLRTNSTGSARIASITIVRTNPETELNETVASVTAFDPPKAHTDLTKLKVTGSVTSTTPGEAGYLELFWNNPSSHQSGTYICEVFIFSQQLSEIFRDSLLVGLIEPTIQELLLYINDLDNRTRALENRVSQIQGGNVQSGVVLCIQGTNDYPVTFSAPFTSVPKVITSLGGSSNSDAYVLTPQVMFVTTAGFTLRCTSFGTNNVVWVAL